MHILEGSVSLFDSHGNPSARLNVYDESGLVPETWWILGSFGPPIMEICTLCSLVSLQGYRKSLTNLQRTSLVEKSRHKPQERMGVLSDALKVNNYDVEPLLKSCGISITSNFTQVEGRVLPAPRLKVRNGEDFFPRNGRWKFNNKKLVNPTTIEKWAVVNFSARCDICNLVRGSDLMWRAQGHRQSSIAKSACGRSNVTTGITVARSTTDTIR
ncbi:argonaute 4-like protein [Tanacetum coccineum]